MRQRPAPFFFRSITLMKARTVRLDTLTYYQGQFPQTRERGDRAMAVIGHPQRLATLLTTLFRACVNVFSCVASRRGVRRAILLLLLGLSPSFCFQATPPVKSSLPFSFFPERKRSLEKLSFQSRQVSGRVLAKTELLAARLPLDSAVVSAVAARPGNRGVAGQPPVGPRVGSSPQPSDGRSHAPPPLE